MFVLLQSFDCFKATSYVAWLWPNFVLLNWRLHIPVRWPQDLLNLKSQVRLHGFIKVKWTSQFRIIFEALDSGMILLSSKIPTLALSCFFRSHCKGLRLVNCMRLSQVPNLFRGGTRWARPQLALALLVWNCHTNISLNVSFVVFFLSFDCRRILLIIKYTLDFAE